MKRRDTGKIFLVVIVIILVIGLVGGVWYVSGRLALLEQQNELLATQASTAQASEDQSSAGATLGSTSVDKSQPESTSPKVDREIITGQARQESAGEDVRVNCYVYGDSVSDVWLQYGNTLVPQERTSREPVETEGAEEKVYSFVTVTLPRSSIEPATIYSYRCAGLATSGTVQGGIASFTSAH